MRSDISSNVENAANAYTVNVVSSAKVYKTRAYFEYADLSLSGISFHETYEVADIPLGQDVKYSSRLGEIVSIFADSDVLKMYTALSGLQTLQYSGSDLETSDDYRPTIWCGDSQEEIFWSSTSGIHFAEADGQTISSSTLILSTATSLGDWYGRNPPAALHAVADQECIALWIDDGGVALSHIKYDGGWELDDWDYRFIDPTDLFTATSHSSELHYSAAVQDDDGNNYVYFTRWDGRVDVVIRSSAGEWSSRRVAIPSDLSALYVTNAFLAPNDGIALVGQFQREDDTGSFSSDVIYNLVCISPNGKTFSLDRNTLFALGNDNLSTSSMGYRFFAGVDDSSPPNMWICNSGSYAETSAPLYLSESAEYTEVPANKAVVVRGQYSGSMSIRVPDGTQFYSASSAALHHGAAIDVFVNFMVSGGSREETLLRRSIIDSVEEQIDEKGRVIVIDTQPYSAWMASEMTHPFYLEMQSKQSVYDDVDAWDNLYEANSSEGLPGFLAIDFWAGESLGAIEHEAGDRDPHLSDDLVASYGYTQYPKVPTLPFTVDVYGWSRAGSHTPYTGGDGDQPSDPDAENDRIALRLIVARGAEGNETEYDIEVTTLDGDYHHFPRTWYTSEDGDYPIVFSCTSASGLQAGDTIRRIGVNVYNDNSSDDTLFYLERLESEDIVVQYPQYGEIWESGTADIQVGDPSSWDFGSAGYLGWEYTPVHDAWTGTSGPGGFWAYLDIGLDGDSITMAAQYLVKSFSVGSMMYEYQGDVFLPPLGEPWSITVDVGPDQLYDSSFGFFFEKVSDGSPTAEIVVRAVRPEGGFGVPAGGWTIDQDFSQFDYYRSPDYKLKSMNYGFYKASTDQVVQHFYSVETEGLIGATGTQSVAAQTLLRAGVPIIRLSTKPYTTFNCQVQAAYSLSHEDLLGGVVVLAADGDNYIAAIAEKTEVKIIKVRDGVSTTLATTSNSISEDEFWIMAKHIDGVISVYISEGFGNPTFSTPVLSYTWQESDGNICTSDDIMHVGTYSMIDTPWVRLTGWSPSETNYIGVLPDSVSKMSEFPSSGTLMVNGELISYTSKITQSDAYGPFQCRNTTYWSSYKRDGGSFGPGKAIEFTHFIWQDASTHKNDYNGYLMASDLGEAHVITATDFKPYIKTNGKLVLLKNRCRCFASDIDDNVHGTNTKMWITGGFSGCEHDGDEASKLIEGDIAFLYGDDYVLQLLAFAASSEHEDATVEDMIQRILYMSGADPSFPGDTLVSSQALTSTETEIT